jgi:hypothetical protein
MPYGGMVLPDLPQQQQFSESLATREIQKLNELALSDQPCRDPLTQSLKRDQGWQHNV